MEFPSQVGLFRRHSVSSNCFCFYDGVGTCSSYGAIQLRSCENAYITIIVFSSFSSCSDVAKQLADQNLTIKGYRGQSTVKVLYRYIPIAAAFGGMCIGCLTIFADFFGTLKAILLFEMLSWFICFFSSQATQANLHTAPSWEYLLDNGWYLVSSHGKHMPTFQEAHPGIRYVLLLF